MDKKLKLIFSVLFYGSLLLATIYFAHRSALPYQADGELQLWDHYINTGADSKVQLSEAYSDGYFELRSSDGQQLIQPSPVLYKDFEVGKYQVQKLPITLSPNTWYATSQYDTTPAHLSIQGQATVSLSPRGIRNLYETALFLYAIASIVLYIAGEAILKRLVRSKA